MKVDFKIIKNYLESSGSDNEKSQIISWFNNLQTEKDLRVKSRIYWDAVPEDIMPENYDESRILGNIYREIKIDENQKRSKNRTLIKTVNFLTKLAAILFIPLIILYVSNIKLRGTQLDQITYTEIHSPPGAFTKFYLPDGSNGWLNGDSYLKFPERFQGNSRNVTLKGEAFFDVVTNPEKPFNVSSKNLVIVATGTSFNVSAWDNVPETEVVMVEGNIDVYFIRNNQRNKVSSLSPGQLLHFVPTKTGTYIQDVDIEKYISWTEGKLIFREDPFSEVVERLNRWYNVNIVIKNEVLESYKYVATFKDETLDEVLKMLTISAPIRYRELRRTQKEDGTFSRRTIELYYKPRNGKKSPTDLKD